MNGFGVGLTVALGTAIGIAVGSPGLDPLESVVTIVFYSLFFGFAFHAWQWALRGFRLPFRRR